MNMTPNNNSKHKVLAGNKYGRITLLEFIGMEKNLALYRAKCDCGKVMDNYNAYNLTSRAKPTTSCGCSRKRPHFSRRKYTESTKAAYFLKFKRHLNRQASLGKKCDDWTVEQWYEVCSKPCYYCGKTDVGNIARMSVHGKKNFSEQEMQEYDLLLNGIDRIDSSIGYTRENSRPCCYRCNVAKSDMKESDFYEMILAIVQHRGLCAGR